jgi:hypothetical protein
MDFVPGLAVFFGFVLALCSVGVLIFFIHHIASWIQASSIIASVARETMAVIEQLFPEQSGPATEDDGDESQGLRVLDDVNWLPIPAEETGYIQSVDREALLRLALARQTTSPWNIHCCATPQRNTGNVPFSFFCYGCVAVRVAHRENEAVPAERRAIQRKTVSSPSAPCFLGKLVSVRARFSRIRYPPVSIRCFRMDTNQMTAPLSRNHLACVSDSLSPVT